MSSNPSRPGNARPLPRRASSSLQAQAHAQSHSRRVAQGNSINGSSSSSINASNTSTIASANGHQPITSTPAASHSARFDATLSSNATSSSGSLSFGQHGSPMSSYQRRTVSASSLGHPGSSSGQAAAPSQSSALLHLDQHNTSSLTLSPRTLPHRRRNSKVSRDRALSAASDGVGNASTSRNRLGLPTSISRSRRSHTNGQRAVSGSDATSLLMDISSASTSGILNGVAPTISGTSVNDTLSSSAIRPSSSPGIGDIDVNNGSMQTVNHLIDGESDQDEDGFLSSSSEASSSASTSISWTLIDRMRLWRNDALNQHLYTTAIFWGGKVFSKSRAPVDGFWLAQCFFASGQYSRAEKVLTSTWDVHETTAGQSGPDVKGKGRAEDQNETGLMDVERVDDSMSEMQHERHSSTTETDGRGPDGGHSRTHASSPHVTFAPPSQASTARPGQYPALHQSHAPAQGIPVKPTSRKTVCLSEVSVACRYLAAQALIRQEKWGLAMEMLGEVNPFAPLPATAEALGNSTSTQAALSGVPGSGDGGIKWAASMCHLRGMVQLHLNAVDRAKECFLEALSLDVKCYESFEQLVGGNMMDIEEEWNFVQGLAFKRQTPEDAEFIKMMYSVRLKKYGHRDEMARCGRTLMKDYGLQDDPDVLYGLADELYTAMRYADCYAITCRILEIHDTHAGTLPLHLACMQHLPNLRARLFLFAHELVDREPESPVSWYAVGLWYYGGRRWEEARRYLGKALLLDSRFGPGWLAFAHSYALEGEHDQAITAYSTAGRNFRGTHLPMLFIGMQYIILSNIKAADEYLDTAYLICQSDPLLLNEMGVAAFYNEKYRDAVGLFTRALQYAANVQTPPSRWAATQLNTGQAHRKLGQHALAIEYYRTALEVEPRNAVAHASMGLSCMYLGQSENAISCFHETLALQPGEPTATALLRLALQDSANHHPRHSREPNRMAFPQLSEVIATEMDERVVGEEKKMFGRAMRTQLGAGEKSYTVSTSAPRSNQPGEPDPSLLMDGDLGADISEHHGRSVEHRRRRRPVREGESVNDGENENDDSTEDSAMMEASVGSDMVD